MTLSSLTAVAVSPLFGNYSNTTTMELEDRRICIHSWDKHLSNADSNRSCVDHTLARAEHLHARLLAARQICSSPGASLRHGS